MASPIRFGSRLLAVGALVWPGALSAQGPATTYTAFITPTGPDASEKLLVSAVTDGLGDGRCALQPGTDKLLITSVRVLTPEEVRGWVQHTGFELVGLVRFGFDHLPEHAAAFLSFPVPPVTDDPQAGISQYEAEKIAWITAHPEAYRALTGTSFGPTPANHADE
jgi:hypothetical protein